MGYANPVKRLDFTDELGSPEDPIWVIIKNPKTQPLNVLRPQSVNLDETGEAAQLTSKQAQSAGQEVAARLIIAWRVYDATATPEFDSLTGDQLPGNEPALLPAPSGGNGVPVELLDKVPTAVLTGIMQEVGAALNPQRAPGAATTSNESSSALSPSTTEPGAPGQ